MIKFLIRDIANNINSEEIKLNEQVDLKSANNMIQSILEKNKPFNKISISFRLIDSDSNKTIISSSGFLVETHSNILDFLKSVDSVPAALIDGIIDCFTCSDKERENIDNLPIIKNKEKSSKNSFDTNNLQKKISKIKEENEKLNKNLRENQKLQNKLKTKNENEMLSILKKQEQLKQELTKKITDNEIYEKNLKNEINSIKGIIEKTKSDISELDKKHIEQKRLLNEKLLKIKEETKKINNEKKSKKNQEQIDTDNLNCKLKEIKHNENLNVENPIEDLDIKIETKELKNSSKVVNNSIRFNEIKRDILQEISKEKRKEQKHFERKEQKYLRELRRKNRNENIFSNLFKKVCFLIFIVYLVYLLVISRNNIESYFSNLINGLKSI